jgi:hypothetical protein
MRRFLLVALTMACAEPVALDWDGTPGLAARVAEGTPEAVGMIAFLNDASTTEALLDDDVRLDRRAARSLIAHRNGPDGVLGTADDDLFDTVREADDCYYVGGSALARIEAYALEHGWVPLGPDDHLGTWDRVDFTVGEAEATVALANSADRDTLDDDLALDSRAVDSILAARPVLSVAHLASLYYVGRSALTKLRDAAVPVCETPGWETLYIYDEGDGAWRLELAEGFVAVVDEVVTHDDWCGEATGEPWFVKATVDLFDCEIRGYTIELGQYMLEYPEVVWYIEFEVTEAFDWFHSTCEV